MRPEGLCAYLPGRLCLPRTVSPLPTTARTLPLAERKSPPASTSADRGRAGVAATEQDGTEEVAKQECMPIRGRPSGGAAATMEDISSAAAEIIGSCVAEKLDPSWPRLAATCIRPPCRKDIEGGSIPR